MVTENYQIPRMGRVKQIHFVGIGGAGMCGIAEVLFNEGYQITGSDIAESSVLMHLRALGIQVFIGHQSANILGADVVVRSTAVKDDNEEILAALEAQIPVIPRAAMLAELMRFRHGIAVAGTHGKTTTTSLVSCLLAEGGLDPSFVIGGKLNSCGTNAQLGKTNYFVAEADESDASFLFLKPMMAIVTNIDADHMVTYGDDFDRLRRTFIEFLHHLPFYGLAVVCLDDPEVRRILLDIQRPTLTYGFSSDAAYRADNWEQNGLMSSFSVHRSKGLKTLKIQFKWPGRHNVLNALAAIAIASELGVNDAAIKRGLLQFQGVGRRFQILGQRQFSNGRALLVDDYGHHPQEIKSTIETCRAVWPNQRLVHVFQPHRYSRTKELFQDFVDILQKSDLLLLMDIYSAGEEAIPGISSDFLAKAVIKDYAPILRVSNHNVEKELNQVVLDGDIVLLQGAGNIGIVANSMMKPSSNLG